MTPAVEPFFHAPTSTWTYVVSDPGSGEAVIIDPVLDYDVKSGRWWTDSAQSVLDRVRQSRLAVRWILETHAHADHLSSAAWLRDQLGVPVAIGAGIRDVQATFRDLLNLGTGFATNGSQFDRLLGDGETLPLGELEIRVLPTPGHTSDSVSYVIGDAVFVGDTVFMPDGGTARCDFPGGDAALLYASVRRLYQLPPATRVFVCHDYQPGGRERLCETSIAAQRSGNIHLRDGVSEQEFVALRRERDATLGSPGLLFPSVQVNIRAGLPPPPEDNGSRYLKLPWRQGRPPDA